MDSRPLQHTEEGKVVSRSENPCEKNKLYEGRFGEDKDKRMSEVKRKTAEHYKTSKNSLAVIQDLATEMRYWKDKAVNCLKYMKKKAS